jgi:riboflavin synthase
LTINEHVRLESLTYRMFTGLIEALGEIAAVVAEPPGVRLIVREARIAATAKVGDSIALNGCCLTVVAVDGDRLSFQAGEETLSRTNLGGLAKGDVVNMERSLRAGDPIGGHYVTGHIDAVGTVDSRHDDREWCTMWFRAPAPQLQQMASKGSVAVDGVSLTLVNVEGERFSVALIPHTLAVTTLGRRKAGDRVNIETDILAKYVQRHVGQVFQPDTSASAWKG